MPVNPKAVHEESINENNKQLAEIMRNHPDDYFLKSEWRKICEENRQHRFQLNTVETMIKNGVKF